MTNRMRAQLIFPPMQPELLAFTIVGSASTAVHFVVVSTLVPIGAAPLIANIVGFLSAFAFSFVGHDRWSFPSSTQRVLPVALRRFFVIAIVGFAANEGTYWWLLSFTSIDYRVALIIVLPPVAALTLVLSKHWAFNDARG